MYVPMPMVEVKRENNFGLLEESRTVFLQHEMQLTVEMLIALFPLSP